MRQNTLRGQRNASVSVASTDDRCGERRTMVSQSTVFLVEDDDQLRRSLTWLLKSHGYRVVPSASTTEALASYEPQVPGCLVLDVQLPEGSGLELLLKFRQRGGTHPFIVMTAYGRVRTAVEAMRLGAVDFLEKPFENNQLVERVVEAVERDLQGRQLDEETRHLLGRLHQLGRREWEVAKLLAEGYSSKQIARVLGIRPNTVQVHRHNILNKLEAASSTEVVALVAQAQALARLGLVELPE